MALTSLNPNLLGTDSAGASKLSTAGGLVQLHSTGLLAIANNSANNFAIANTGRVGMGTNSPAVHLDVVSPTNGSTAWAWFHGNCGGAVPPTDVNSGLLLGGNYSAGNSESNIMWGTGYNSATQHLTFSTWNSSTNTISEKVRFAANGNVGIGTTTPSGTLDVASRGITKGSMPSGSVIQVATYTKTDPASTNSTTMVDTGLNVSITPTSSSSKILILISINLGHSDFGVKRTYFKVAGGNAASYIGTAGPSGHTDAFAVCHRAGDVYSMVTAVGTYLDSPATTSSITYKLQYSVETTASSAYLNRPATDDANGSRTASTITVLEIAQ